MRHTSRKGSSKILQLKSGNWILNKHKSKIDHETQQNCGPVKQKKHQNITLFTLGNMKKKGRCYLIQQKIKENNSQCILTLTIEDVLGEQDFVHDDHKSLRKAFEKYINSTKKGF